MSHPTEGDDLGVQGGNLSSYADVVRINEPTCVDHRYINALGGNLLRVRKRHPCVGFLRISFECLQAIELAVYDIVDDDDENAWFRDELCLSGDIEDDLRALGADIGHCPNLKRLEITTNNVMGDDDYASLFEEASCSRAIETIVFKNCNIDRADPVSSLFGLTNLREVIFKSCCISALLVDLLGEYEDDMQHWNSVRFVDCRFDSRGVDADVVTMLTTMSELRHVEFKNSGLGSNAVRILLRDVRDRHDVSVKLEN